MDGASILLVVAAVGVSFGWQPAKEDPQAYEVTAQIEPELLDVLKSGREIPIEANVPANVAPIRKVRIVVGKSTLPRETLNAAAKPTKTTDRVVRGQEPTPQTHTARYENDPWSTSQNQNGGTAPPNRQFDQRGATIGVDSIRTAQAPSPWDRAQTAATETGNTLRDGVEAGIQQANDQFSRAGDQVSNSANDFGQSVNQQYQNLTGNLGQAPPTSWPAPPPAAAQSTAPIATPAFSAPTLSAPANRAPTTTFSAAPSVAPPTTSWSNIRQDLAPPRFLNPTMPPATRTAASVASQPAPPLHSVLADPNAGNSSRSLPPPPLTNSSPNWESGWGAAGASAAGGAATNAAARTTQPTATNTTPIRDPAEEARWAWPAPTNTVAASPVAAPVAASPTADDRYSASPAPTNAPPKDIWADFPPVQPAATPATNQYATQPAQNPAAVPPTIGTAPANTAVPPGTPTVPSEQLPWIPLLAVSVSLAGSLGANLFLGWSYADARNRYRNLVRKTTDSFHRATGVAA